MQYSPRHARTLGGCLSLYTATIAIPPEARAHGITGARVFISTLTIDDPSVADEASLPTGSFQPNANGGTQQYQYNVNVELNKRITERFGIGVNYGYALTTTQAAKTRTGFQNLDITPKCQLHVSPEHEFMVAIGVIQSFGGTGTRTAGTDPYGSTTPTIYWGKGLGDLPIGYLRPLAIAGAIGYGIANTRFKDNDNGGNNGNDNIWIGGLSLQYSMPYLRSQMRDLALPEFVNRLTPVVELAWSSTANRSSVTPTRYTLAPGLAYSGDVFQIAAELLVPLNGRTGTSIGFIAQFHLYFDDLLPHSLGKPLLQW